MSKTFKNSELRTAIAETANALREGVKNPFIGGTVGNLPDDVKAKLKAHLDQLLTCEQARACGVNTEAQTVFGELTSFEGNLEWSNTLLDGERVDYSAAEKAVEKLGDGWRLPTRQELESLLDLSRHEPAIDTDKYPDTKSACYWTSSKCAWNEAARWVVHFDLGLVVGGHQDSLACVRAVRASQ